MKIIMIEWECLDCGLVQQDKFKSQNQEIFCFKCIEIINEFKGKDVLDFAILGYINKIIIDLTQNTRERKYAIPNESLKYFYSNISYKGSYEDFLQEFQCKIW